MKEFIEMISAISVLIASIAGASAVNKWKMERFEKNKIDSFEIYFEEVKKLIQKRDQVLKQDLEWGFISMSEGLKINNKITEIFEVLKRDEIEKMKPIVDGLNKVVVEYCSYAGNRMWFNYNYFRSMYSYMRESNFRVAAANCDTVYTGSLKAGFEDEILKELGFYDETGGMADYLDAVVVQDFVMVRISDINEEKKIVDVRQKYDNHFMDMIRLERKIIHSNFVDRFFSRLKLELMQYDAIGRVWCKSDKAYVYIDVDGSLKRGYFFDRGESIENVEKKFRKGLWLQCIKRAIGFSDQREKG